MTILQKISLAFVVLVFLASALCLLSPQTDNHRIVILFLGGFSVGMLGFFAERLTGVNVKYKDLSVEIKTAHQQALADAEQIKNILDAAQEQIKLITRDANLTRERVEEVEKLVDAATDAAKKASSRLAELEITTRKLESERVLRGIEEGNRRRV